MLILVIIITAELVRFNIPLYTLQIILRIFFAQRQTQTSVSRVDDSEPQLSPHPGRECQTSGLAGQSSSMQYEDVLVSPPVLRRGSSYDTPGICLVWHSRNVAERRKTPCLDNSRQAWLPGCPSHLVIPHVIVPFDSKRLSQTPLVEGVYLEYISLGDCPAIDYWCYVNN